MEFKNYWLEEKVANYNENNNEALTSTDFNNIVKGEKNAGNQLGLANPATEMANKIIAFFKGMPNVSISYAYAPEKSEVSDIIKNCRQYRGTDEVRPSIVSIYVTDTDVADYLNRTIKHHYDFGGILLDVIVIDASKAFLTAMDPVTHGINEPVMMQLKKALKDNPNMIDFFAVHVDIFNFDYYFIETSSKPIVFQNDNFANLRGFDTRLPIDLFKEIFDSTQYGGETPTLAGILVSTHVSEFKR